MQRAAPQPEVCPGSRAASSWYEQRAEPAACVPSGAARLLHSRTPGSPSRASCTPESQSARSTAPAAKTSQEIVAAPKGSGLLRAVGRAKLAGAGVRRRSREHQYPATRQLAPRVPRTHALLSPGPRTRESGRALLLPWASAVPGEPGEPWAVRGRRPSHRNEGLDKTCDFCQ